MYILSTCHFLVIVDPVIQKLLPGSPPYHDVMANLSGCLINSHSIYEVAMPRIPTFVNILGSMIPKSLEPLPKAGLKEIYVQFFC